MSWSIGNGLGDGITALGGYPQARTLAREYMRRTDLPAEYTAACCCYSTRGDALRVSLDATGELIETEIDFAHFDAVAAACIAFDAARAAGAALAVARQAHRDVYTREMATAGFAGVAHVDRKAAA